MTRSGGFHTRTEWCTNMQLRDCTRDFGCDIIRLKEEVDSQSTLGQSDSSKCLIKSRSVRVQSVRQTKCSRNSRQKTGPKTKKESQHTWGAQDWNPKRIWHRRRDKEKQVQHIRVEQSAEMRRGEWHTSRRNAGEKVRWHHQEAGRTGRVTDIFPAGTKCRPLDESPLSNHFHGISLLLIKAIPSSLELK